MGSNRVELKSVGEILGKNFFIPNYQRGYRWSRQQVDDLLNDIKNFKTSNPSSYQFYCLQPLVIHRMSPQECQAKDLADGEWDEVIDGQQRLTTILLILKALQEFFPRAFEKRCLYTLKYQRNDCLEQFFDPSGNRATENDSSIDLHYISEAYDRIRTWLETSWECGIMDALVQCNKDEAGRDQANNVRFIWYEAVDEDPIQVFTRLNIGQIALTNAELIKAMILNRSNFKTENDDYAALRQREIASEWDSIEYQLQKDEFWLFLHEPGYANPTRIDYIFELICDSDQLSLEWEKSDDGDKSFRYFYEYFQRSGSDVNICWEAVKRYFNMFNEWYNDVELYHYIGFLIAQGVTAEELSKTWASAETKSEFTAGLKRMVKEIVTEISLDYQFDEEGSDKRECRPILLFHNIQTVINRNRVEQGNAKYGLGTFYKFPFHLYKLESWDVEHINSNTTNPEEDKTTREEWLVNTFLSLPAELQDEIRAYFDKRNETLLGPLFNKVSLFILEPNEWSQDDKNKIWNYTLLDSSTNRGYGNAIFSSKRRIIIGKDSGVFISIPTITGNGLEMVRANKGESAFVPPCTRNVFMKYYTPALNDPNYWTKDDAKYYLEDIRHCIEQLG